MDKAQKAQVVEELGQVFSESGVVVVAHYAGLSVAEMSDLRGRMREGGASVRVAKNTLSRIALKDTPCAGIADLFQGQTVMAYSEDPVAAAKIAVSYAKENQKLAILGGSMGETALDPDGVKALADMPSLDELRAKLCSVLKAPATKVARVAQAPAVKLAMVFKAYAEKDKEDAA